MELLVAGATTREEPNTKRKSRMRRVGDADS